MWELSPVSMSAMVGHGCDSDRYSIPWTGYALVGILDAQLVDYCLPLGWSV